MLNPLTVMAARNRSGAEVTGLGAGVIALPPAALAAAASTESAMARVPPRAVILLTADADDRR